MSVLDGQTNDRCIHRRRDRRTDEATDRDEKDASRHVSLPHHMGEKFFVNCECCSEQLFLDIPTISLVFLLVKIFSLIATTFAKIFSFSMRKKKLKTLNFPLLSEMEQDKCRFDAHLLCKCF